MARRLLFALALVGACRATDGGGEGASRTWSYALEVRPGGRELAVRAVLPPPARASVARRLAVAPAALDAVRDLALDDGTPLERSGDGWLVPPDHAGPLVLRYRFEPARVPSSRRGPVQVHADPERTAFVVEPAAFLVRPAEPSVPPVGTVVELEAAATAGTAFASGIRRRADGRFAFAARRLDALPYTVFGELAPASVPVGDAEVEVVLLPGRTTVGTDDVVDFVARSAEAVAGFYGRFPVGRSLVLAVPARRGGYGRAMGNGGASVLYLLDRRDDRAELFEDWVLVHELVHFACPLLPRRHHWFEEGLATYLEPIIRQRAGLLTAEEVWGELAAMLPNGLPRPGDRGLDETRTWGRTYWGGALFALLADVEIRARSDNAESLDDALRAVVLAGGSIATAWSMEETLAVADGALSAPVLTPLWEAMRSDPYPVDLVELWSRLGVVGEGRGVRFDERASLAHVRRAIAGDATGLVRSRPAAAR